MTDDLTEQIGSLMKAITKRWRMALDHRLAYLGMSEARWLCLLHLGRQAHGALPQVELAEAIGITPPSLVKLLDRLEEDGWAERQPEPQDRRAKRVSLTPKARDMVQRIEAEATQLRLELMEEISIKDRQTFLRVLQHMTRKMDAISYEPARPR